MPYLGLFDKDGKEVAKRDYYRIDLSEIYFKMSPAKDTINHFIIINAQTISFPTARSDWGMISVCGIFNEVDDVLPVHREKMVSKYRVRKHDQVIMVAGQLRFEIKLYKNEFSKKEEVE